jgi:hypothetical protein
VKDSFDLFGRLFQPARIPVSNLDIDVGPYLEHIRSKGEGLDSRQLSYFLPPALSDFTCGKITFLAFCQKKGNIAQVLSGSRLTARNKVHVDCATGNCIDMPENAFFSGAAFVDFIRWFANLFL